MKCPFETRSLFRGHSFISVGGVPNISAESFPLSVKNGVQLFSVILCQKDSAGSIGQQHQLYLQPPSPDYKTKPPQTGAWGAASPSIKGYPTEKHQEVSHVLMKHPFFEDSLPIFFLLHKKILPPKTNMEPGNESQKESTLPGVHFRVPCWFLGEILNL